MATASEQPRSLSRKERVVILDRAAFTADELPIPAFDHNWSEYPDTEAADIVPRLFWATTAITHACPIEAEAIGQLHKLKRIVAPGRLWLVRISARRAESPCGICSQLMCQAEHWLNFLSH